MPIVMIMYVECNSITVKSFLSRFIAFFHSQQERWLGRHALGRSAYSFPLPMETVQMAKHVWDARGHSKRPDELVDSSQNVLRYNQGCSLNTQ